MGLGSTRSCLRAYARERLQPLATLQGNLNPVLLIAGGVGSKTRSELRRELGAGPYIFYLGHGVLPETPRGNVAALARLLAEPVVP